MVGKLRITLYGYHGEMFPHIKYILGKLTKCLLVFGGLSHTLDIVISTRCVFEMHIYNRYSKLQIEMNE